MIKKVLSYIICMNIEYVDVNLVSRLSPARMIRSKHFSRHPFHIFPLAITHHIRLSHLDHPLDVSTIS